MCVLNCVLKFYLTYPNHILATRNCHSGCNNACTSAGAGWLPMLIVAYTVDGDPEAEPKAKACGIVQVYQKP